jgi:AraC family transcriptional regulator
MKTRKEQLLPLLLDIEGDLEQDLGLASLATRFGASEFHFHRTFADTIGETPRQHIERLRLEKAAMQLAVGDQPITELAFSLGFRNLETFSRRFKAELGHSPSAYRQLARAAQAERVCSRNFHESNDYFLSRARFDIFADMHLLAVRHVGDYGALNLAFGAEGSAWSELRELARRAGLACDGMYVGLYLDDPTLTPVEQRRCDLCISLRGQPGPLAGKARYLELKGGMYASAQYVGEIGFLLNAYQGLADEIRRSRHTFRDGIPLLLPRSANVGGQPGVHSYAVCFPIMPKR